MQITAFIPIRMHNERLPRKNINPLGDKPLCSYVFETLLQSKCITKICVYCSDEAIVPYLPEGIEWVHRDPMLDRNETKTNDLVQSFAQDVASDLYVMTHVTSPFVSIQSIDNSIEAVLSQQYDSALCVERIQTFLWHKEQPLNYSFDMIPRTQDLEPLYSETSGFYVYNKDIALKGIRIGSMPYFHEADQREAIDIDTIEDFRFAEYMLQNQHTDS